MFDSLTIYRISEKWNRDPVAALEGLELDPFTPTGPTQEYSGGWVPPRGEEHGAIIETVGGHWIAKYTGETRAVPSANLDRKVDAKAKAIEQERGYKPGKRERREIKDEIKRELLPQAFPKRASVWVWIDPDKRLLVVGTASQATVDKIITALVDRLPGLEVGMLSTNTSPTAAMANWLNTHEAPGDFYIDRACELQAVDDSKAAVRYVNHTLDTVEVREHIDNGLIPSKLALTYDGRVSFVLVDTLQLRKIEFLDVTAEEKDPDVDAFDADIALATGELSAVVRALIEALDGERMPLPAVNTEEGVAQ